MNEIDLPTLIGPRLAELWAKYPASTWTHDAQGPLNPLYSTSAWPAQVVVLGLTPSLTPGHREWASYSPDYASPGYFKRMGDFMKKAAHKYDELFQSAPSAAPSQPAATDKLAWFHLDLLYVRATRQRTLEQSIWATPEAASFCWEQLQLTKNLLAHLRPTMLIVANRFGQRLTGFHYDKSTGANEWMGLQFAAELDAHGMHKITGSTTASKPDAGELLSLIGIPVLFTNSFAGTSVRSKATDEKDTEQIAAAYSYAVNAKGRL